jgi:hypothetical protein
MATRPPEYAETLLTSRGGASLCSAWDCAARSQEGTIMFRQRTLDTILLAAGVAVALAACTPTAPGGDAPGGDPDDQGGSFSGVTLPGTGRYAIGTEAPFGSYQLKGEPDSQPEGCTWSIEDADGGATFADQGSYVFITDIKEAVTFVTNGCPDWEQYE